ncbi:MAG: hypothetical protein ACKOTB_11765, partial [Planctomycetia bacterium]
LDYARPARAPRATRYPRNETREVDRSLSTVILCPRGRQGSLLLPNTVTRIAAKAFADCDGLTSIVIPGSVKEIPSGRAGRG